MPIDAFRCVVVGIALLVAGRHELVAQPAPASPATGWPEGEPQFPAELPGGGAAHHDFFYAGEAKTQDMYLVRGGKVAWEYHNPGGKGEISDAVLLSDGKVLFAHQHGVTLIDGEKKVLWHRDALADSEIHTAQPIGAERLVFVENGPKPRAVVVNWKTDTVEREFPLPVKNLKSTHGQFRHARLTPAGTLLVAHMDLGLVAEYDSAGKQVWSIPAPGVWSAERLTSGNTLVTCGRRVFEANAAGETVWELTPGDLPDYRVSQFQVARRLANGNTLVNNWVNQWSGPIDAKTVGVQAWEVTPGKRVVWALREWGDRDGGLNLGPATRINVLEGEDGKAIPEAVRFGEFH